MLPHNVLQAERIDSKENTGFADSVRKVRALEAGGTFQSAPSTWVYTTNIVGNVVNGLPQPGSSRRHFAVAASFSGCHLTYTCGVDLVVVAAL
jgi:hypothetical protein